LIDQLEYNTEREILIIPEYGRHIQKMVNQVLEIKDRDQRNKMAKAIIDVMGNLNPHLRDVPDFQHKIWDQLFIMSDFKLDADSPYPKPLREVLEARPEPLGYPQNFPKYRFYGNNIKKMIDVAIGWEESDMKKALVHVIATHMKKSFLNWNKDTVDDAVIYNHLLELSDGKIAVKAADAPLTVSEDLIRISNKKSSKHSSNNKSNYSKGRKGGGYRNKKRSY
jgi:hypothetical protein